MGIADLSQDTVYVALLIFPAVTAKYFQRERA